MEEEERKGSLELEGAVQELVCRGTKVNETGRVGGQTSLPVKHLRNKAVPVFVTYTPGHFAPTCFGD